MDMRLNKYIAQTGLCSRRKADELIKQGKIRVNDKVVKDLGYKINPKKDKVFYQGKELKPEKKEVFIKLYKPRGYLSELGKDKFGRKTLTDLFKEIGIKENVYPVGRLDYDSEGLLLLTNAGDYAYKISHPKFKVPKTYLVEVEGNVNLETFNKMKKGIMLEDGFLKPDDLKIIKKKKNRTLLEITIHSGKKRVIRRFMKAFGHPVIRLIRQRIGNIKLDNLNKDVKWKYIDKKTVQEMIKRYDKRNYFK